MCTDGQSLDARVAELTAAGAGTAYREKVSGTVTDRAALKRAIATVLVADLLLVTRHRLARSTRNLLNILDALAKKGAGFRLLRDAWADTTMAHGRLMLVDLGGLAEFERELILVRTGEGRQREKDRGIRLGRRPKLRPRQRREALARREHGGSIKDVPRSYAVITRRSLA